MALRIFDTDPEEMIRRQQQARRRTWTEYAFEFRSGRVVNRRPVSLSTWRVLTGDPGVADAVAQLMGGTPEEWDPAKEMHLEVVTEQQSVEVIIDGPEVIDERLILWGRTGPVHECDGEFYLSPAEDKGRPCGCPRLLRERKEAARAGRGPSPSITVPFRLAHDPELGLGRYVAHAWSFAEHLHELKQALLEVGEPALCHLRIEQVEYTTPAGETRRFRKPVVDVLGSYNTAIAEDR